MGSYMDIHVLLFHIVFCCRYIQAAIHVQTMETRSTVLYIDDLRFLLQFSGVATGGT